MLFDYGAFALISLLPILLLWVLYFFSDRRTPIQFVGLATLGLFVVATFMTAMIASSQVWDRQIMNGEVTKKYRDTVSCSHSYSCNCHTVTRGSGKDRYTTEECDTCYEHRHDYDWVVETTVGNLDIDRVNRQGDEEPPRFTKVVIGEPASREGTFKNYIKAAPQSLFNNQLLQSPMPEVAYPNVYDYYRINRVLCVGCTVPQVIRDRVNLRMNMALKQLGPKRHLNIVVVFTNQPQSYTQVLQARWVGGKQNDIVVLLNPGQWSSAFSFSKTTLVNYEMQDSINAVKFEGDYADALSDAIIAGTKSFVRKHMSEYEYLKADIHPSMGAIILCLILNLAFAVGFFFGVRDMR